MDAVAAAPLTVAAEHFRNYHAVTADIPPRWTVVVGPNGAGKTNFLELLTVGLRGIPFHGGRGDLLQWGAQRTRVEVRLASGDVITTDLRRDGARVERLRQWNAGSQDVPEDRVPPLVLFTPQEDRLLDHVAGRRQLFGRGILLRSTQYANAVAIVRRALQQRNALLHAAKDTHLSLDDTTHLHAWTDALVEPVAAVWRERLAAVRDVNLHLPTMLGKLGGIPFSLALHLSLGGMGDRAVPPAAEDIRDAFTMRAAEERARGATLVGPHRDIVSIQSEGRDVLPRLSRGQRRVFLLALHLIEAALPSKGVHLAPIFLLDDVFSELDPDHRQSLVATLRDATVILTTADPHILTELAGVPDAILTVRAGSLERAGVPSLA